MKNQKPELYKVWEKPVSPITISKRKDELDHTKIQKNDKEYYSKTNY